MNVNNSRLPAMVVGFLGLIASAVALTNNPASTPNAQTGDALFSQMTGHWVGQGSRFYPLSGRTVQVTTEVEATVGEMNGVQRLTSTNQITETPSSGNASSYETDYWIEPLAGKPSNYTLGYSVTTPGAPTVTSLGVLGTDGVFRSDQDLGNGYNIHSETRFSGNSSTYTEITTNGPTVVLKTTIDYTKR